MRTKEEYYDNVLKKRKIVADPNNLKCTCTNTLCDWHGKCKECVALHRFENEHIPACLKPVFHDTLESLESLFGIFDMEVTKKEDTPPEYYRYVKERDAQGHYTE